MDCAIGIVGDGFVLLAADTSAVQSIIKMKTDEDKILLLDSHKLMVRRRTAPRGGRPAPAAALAGTRGSRGREGGPGIRFSPPAPAFMPATAAGGGGATERSAVPASLLFHLGAPAAAGGRRALGAELARPAAPPRPAALCAAAGPLGAGA